MSFTQSEARAIYALIRHIAPAVTSGPPYGHGEVLEFASWLADRASAGPAGGPNGAAVRAAWPQPWEMHLLDRDGDLWSRDVADPDMWVGSRGGRASRATVEDEYGPVEELWSR